MSNAFTSDKSKKAVYQWEYNCISCGCTCVVKEPLIVKITCRCGAELLFNGPVITFE